jgi:hypothetical protein
LNPRQLEISHKFCPLPYVLQTTGILSAYGFEKERLEIYSAERKCFLNVIQHLGFGNALAKVQVETR